MDINLNKESEVDIFVDENKNLALFSFIANPEYVFSPEPTYDPIESSSEILPVFYSKTAFELEYPYTINELAGLIERGIGSWNKLEPYTAKRKTIEEYYYKVSGFKKATRGKKMIVVGWDGTGKRRISISLPAKAGKYYLGIDYVNLPEDSDWVDMANAVMNYIEADITQFSSYKTFKRRLNV